MKEVSIPSGFGDHCKVKVRVMFELLKRFRRDESGSATTEWVVAVGIVVLMGIPVLAVVGDGSEQTSSDMIVSINDTDSFGGSDFHGDEGAVTVAAATTDYVPGSDMGVGFPSEEELRNSVSVREARPIFIANNDDILRRDKPNSSGLGAGGIAISSGGDTTPRAVPQTPRLMEQHLGMGPDQCVEVEDVVAEVEVNLNDPVTVVASGR